MEACPTEAIEIQDGFAHIIMERCNECGVCAEVCPQGAVLLLAEPDLQELTVAKPEEQPADRSQEVIKVRVPPPPTLAPERPSPARQLGLALGGALTFLGREVAPRLLRLAVDWVEEQIRTPQETASRSIQRQSAQDEGGRRQSAQRGNGGGRRRRRQRRGRQ
jgi:ferredoxin